MEEQDDEVEITMESSTTSSWLAAEGTLDQSVKVVEESEDAIYTAGPTSRLVLVQPSSTASESSAPNEPCELTVTFEKRYNYIHQIYVLSTARICEIYGQKEQNGDREYVCTLHGELTCLMDDEDSADDASNVSPDAAVQEGLISANSNSNATSSVPLAIPKLASGKEDQAAESVIIGEMEFSQPIDESSSPARRDSEDNLFRSFTEASNGKTIEGSVIFEESLDHAEWVECPHSPTKSIVSTGDEEAEVDITKGGFYFIDVDVEGQKLDHPQVRFFPDAIRDWSKNATNYSLERAEIGSSGHSSWQEVIDEPTYEKGTDATSPPGSTSERDSEETRTIILEPYPPSLDYKSVPTQVDGFTDDVIGKNLPRSGFGVFEGNEERDSSNLAMANSTPCEAIIHTDDDSTQVLEASSLEMDVGKSGDLESRYPVDAPVYECEVELEDADAWTSVTIRLLSVKSKNQVQIHRVVVTYTPGLPNQSPITTSSDPFQQGVGYSSLTASLILGILQTARGIPEPRIAKNSLSSSAEKGIGGSDGLPCKVTNGESSSPSQHLPIVQDVAVDVVEMNKSYEPSTADMNLNCEAGEKASCHSDVAKGDSRGTSSLVSVAHRETRGRNEFEESKTVNKEIGVSLQAHQKEERVDELVQRLERLEKICLRMESSLNASLGNMNKRLEALERMPPVLGPTIWGPGFDSGSFVSATSAYVPVPQMGAGTSSLIDSPVPKEWYPPTAAEVPVGESAMGVSDTQTPVYPSVPSSTSPPSLSSSLPSWPLSSLPQHVSHDTSSHSSCLTASFITKSGLMNCSNGSLHGSEHLSIGGETYWESRTSAGSKSDISSDSEQTSYADNCEDLACGCCPESLSSSPTNPAQLVDNALASALSAFSASFGPQNKVLREEVEFHLDEEGSDEEDSFTSEEQVPLVDLESIPCFYEKDLVVDGDVENGVLHGYEAIPLSSDKDTGDVSISKVVLEENFWRSEFEESQQMSWQDDGLQNQEKKSGGALKDSITQMGEGTTTFDSSSGVFIQVSNQPSLVDDTFSSDLEGVFQKSVVKETKEGDDVGPVSKAPMEDAQEDPLLQELVAGGDGNARGAQSAWHQQDWTGEQAEIAKNVLSSYLAARALPKPFDSHDEMLQEGLFPDDWNWFTAEFSPFSSLVEVTDLSEDVPVDKKPVAEHKEAVNILDGELDGVPSTVSPSHLDSWSLLDGDVSMPSTTQQFGRDIRGQDWLGQKSQWSLLDGNPPDLMSGDTQLEAGSQDGGSYGNTEQRSLLDEDISVPAGKVPNVNNDVNLFSSNVALQEHVTLIDAIQSSTYEDLSGSHSSDDSRSNPSEDEFGEELDFSRGSNNASVTLHEFEEEVHKLEATESKGTESLLFHLSL